ncbi:MAG: hypothetical protein KGK03_01805 [Candidatus Omnitrophica bacterium]|nr:hypothetical protein [Candidatus Omnitrophota bacterium]MDE2221784.1 hypothetical protein [Candidatus Omnitrophota bacterium]
MRISVNHSSFRGQTSIEYLLLLAVVAVVVITAFSRGGLIDKVRNTAGDYYNTVTRVIMDSDDGTRTLPNGKTASVDTPNPIDGGWCPVVCPTGSGPTTIYGACECPAPAFGGQGCPSLTVSCLEGKETAGPNTGGACKGQVIYCGGTTSCGPCPAGQSCGAPPPVVTNTPGCGCADGLTCDPNQRCTPGLYGCPDSCTPSCTRQTCPQCYPPTGSIPDAQCSSCECPSGSFYDQASNSCLSYCPKPPGAVSSCNTWNGTSCVPVNCGTNQYCDTSKPPACQCQCDQYSYWNGYACVYCTADTQGHCTLPVSTGGSGPCNTGATTTCQSITCPNNMYCNTAQNACQCIAGTSWNGTACVTTKINGACGTTEGSCTAGTAGSITTTNSTYTWTCQGSGGGSNASCCAPVVACPTSGTICGKDACGNTCPGATTCGAGYQCSNNICQDCCTGFCGGTRCGKTCPNTCGYTNGTGTQDECCSTSTPPYTRCLGAETITTYPKPSACKSVQIPNTSPTSNYYYTCALKVTGGWVTPSCSNYNGASCKKNTGGAAWPGVCFSNNSSTTSAVSMYYNKAVTIECSQVYIPGGGA